VRPGGSGGTLSNSAVSDVQAHQPALQFPARKFGVPGRDSAICFRRKHSGVSKHTEGWCSARGGGGGGMNSEVYAEFLRALGHSAPKARPAFWFDPFPGTRLAFPSHQAIAPDQDELRLLFRRAGLLRSLPNSGGAPSHYIACSDPHYGLPSLERKAR